MSSFFGNYGRRSYQNRILTAVFRLIIAIHEAQIALAKCQWRRDEAGAIKVNEELVRLTALSKKNNEALQSLRGAL